MHTHHIYKNPDKYSVSNNLQYDFAMQLIRRSGITKDVKLLDIGCGDGRITAEIAKLAGVVEGTDISDSMVKHAAHTYSKQTNLHFSQMDAAKNSFKNQYDVITSFNCLHWVKDQESALKGIAYAATENAKIILLLSHKKSNYHFALDAVCSNPKWSRYFEGYVNPRSFFECDKYREMLEKAGLEVDSLLEKELTYHYDSLVQFKAFVSSSMANVKQIPEEKKEDFLEDYSKEFLKLLGVEHYGKIPVSFWCLEVFAKKPALENKLTDYPQIRSRL